MKTHHLLVPGPRVQTPTVGAPGRGSVGAEIAPEAKGSGETESVPEAKGSGETEIVPEAQGSGIAFIIFCRFLSGYPSLWYPTGC